MKLPALILCGQVCVDPNWARPLYAAAYQAMTLTKEKVEIDFTGVTEVSASFLSVISILTEHFKRSVIEERIRWIGLDAMATIRLDVVMNHAYEYQNDKTNRKIIDFVTQQAPDAEEPPADAAKVPSPTKPKGPRSPFVQDATTVIET